MKTRLGVVTMVSILLALSGPAAAGLGSAIQGGADRVVAVQYTDGKWGWPIDVPPTYDNITGPIGIGLLSAYGQTADADHLNSAAAAGNSLVGLTSDWVGTYNPMFLVELYDQTANGSYMTQAQTFFSELQAGTYTRKSVDYDTAGWITLIQTVRTGAWQNLRPWEFGPQAYAASRAGNQAQVDAFVQAIKDGLESLDSSNPDTVYCDLIGLAGGVMGLGWMGEDFDPTSGPFASAGSTADLADLLAGFQNPNGSWYHHSSLGAPGTGDEDIQTTAYAMLALLANNDSRQYDDEILLARAYLLGTQLPNGGWPSYPPDGQEYSETDGEVLWALGDTAAVPEPATLGLLGLGGLGLLIRRERRQ